jgi:hypothetical protein
VTIAEPLHKTLGAVAGVMGAARDPWWIIASAAAVLHGAALPDVADVDVLMSIEDARRILPTLGLVAHRGPEDLKFQSDVFATWGAPPLPVDFLAGFRVRQEDRWLPVAPVTRQAIDIGGAIVYIPEREELRRIIESFGRPKDLERARLLAELDK